jgi:hypothetical protein
MKRVHALLVILRRAAQWFQGESAADHDDRGNYG